MLRGPEFSSRMVSPPYLFLLIDFVLASPLEAPHIFFILYPEY